MSETTGPVGARADALSPKVTHDGAVSCRDCGHSIGWLDRWAASVAEGRGRRWRYVLPGGFSHGGYRQRGHALADLLAHSNHLCRGAS